MNDETFASRDEAIDFGKDYEYLIAAYYSLVFSLNDEVSDFKISTNNNDMGDFDDVVIEVELNNGQEHVFAVQLKHVDRPIAQITLITQNKKFSLKKYSKEFQKVKTNYAKTSSYTAPFDNFHFVLFSNSTLEKFEEFDENWKKLEPVADGKKVQSEVFIQRTENCFGKELLDVSQTNKTFLYKFKSEKEDSPDEEFFKQFSFYTNQKNAKEMESLIAEIILKKFKSCDPNVAVNYLNYFNYWCRRDFGTSKLTKEDVRVKLAELVLTQFIPEPNTNKMNYFSVETAESLLLMLTLFDIVLIENHSEELMNRIWNILLKQFIILSEKWSTPLSGFYMDAVKETLDIPMSAFSENFSEMTMKRLYILQWHTGGLPLVIKIDKSMECQKDILLAIKLSKNKDSKKKFVLIDEHKCFKDNVNWTIFRCLEDIDKYSNELYNALIKTMLVSVQGRRRVPLEQFTGTDLVETISATEVILMLDNTFVIGKDCKKNFPKHYIRRLVPKVLIDIHAIEELDDLFVVSSDDAIVRSFNINSVDINKYLLLKQSGNKQQYLPKQYKTSFLGKIQTDPPTLKEKFLILAPGGCTRQQFRQICSMNPGRNCHLVQFVDNQRIQWIDTRGKIDQIQEYRLEFKTFKPEDFVQDKDVLGHFNNRINVICAEPGMGKSVMMQFLALSCSSRYWVIMVNLGEHADFFKHRRSNDEILDYLLKIEAQTCFVNRIVNILSSKKRIMFLWDGFDELAREHTDLVVATIERLALEGYPQWLAARSDSRKFLEATFNTFSVTLAQFSQENQGEYIYAHLRGKYEDERKIEEIVNKMTASITDSLNFGYYDYAGVPLQIHMLVEIYLRKPHDVEDRNFFTITDMYQEFIEGKFDSLFEKADADPNNYYMEEMREQYRNSQLILYQRAAIKATFVDELLVNVNVECDKLFNELKDGEDSLGLIVGVKERKALFAHKTYQEFLAASWLVKNRHNYVELIKILFEENYSNVRFMFDMLLARDSPVHLAVLYRNLDMIKQHKEEIETCRDKGGRSALHVACSWGCRHPIIKVMTEAEKIEPTSITIADIYRKYLEIMESFQQDETKILLPTELLTSFPTLTKTEIEMIFQRFQELTDSPTVPNTVAINVEVLTWVYKEDTTYLEIVKLLQTHCKTLDNDKLLEWNSIQHADEAEALATLDQLSKYHNIQIESLKKCNHIATLAHYSVGFSYDNLLELITDMPYIEYRYHIERVSLLKVAADVNNLKAVKKLLTYDCYQDVINAKSVFSGNALTSAILEDNQNMMDVLLEHGAQVAGLTDSPLVLAASTGKIACCKKLLGAGANVNGTGPDGYPPLIASAKSNQPEIMKLLLGHGADVNFIFNDFTALNFAVSSGSAEMVQLLLDYQPDISRHFGNSGYTALHHASQLDNLEILKCLLEHGANPTIKSKRLSLTPLHVALLFGKKENAVELIKAEPSVVNEYSDQDVKMTPMMQATIENFPEVIQVLAAYGADVHAKESSSTPLHYAASQNFDSCVDALLEAGSSVNRVDEEGLVPLFLATNSLTTTQILLDHSADINVRSKLGETVLHFAANKGNIDVAEELLNRGAKIDAKDDQNQTPLVISILSKHPEMVKLLLDHDAFVGDDPNLLCLSAKLDLSRCISLLVQSGADVNASDKDGNTPLFYASLFGNSCVKTLLESGADPNNCGLFKASPLALSILLSKTEITTELVKAGADLNQGFESFSTLHIAAVFADIFSLLLLLEKGADLNIVDKVGRTPLHYACTNREPPPFLKKLLQPILDYGLDFCINDNREDCTEELILRGSNVNQEDNEGMTPLHLACQDKLTTTIINLLIKHGADVNALNKCKQSPLHLCYAAEKIEDADLLLENGADLSVVDEFGKNPLDYAMDRIVRKLDLDALDKLRKLGANINHHDDTGLTLLHAAAKIGDSRIVQHLLENDANVENKTSEACTPVFYACQNNHKEIVLMLLKNDKCDVNVQNENGDTPLHVAAANGHVEIMKTLISVGCDINTPSKEGYTPLIVAAICGNYNSCQILLNAGGNINQADDLGHTPLHHAVMTRQKDVVKLLVNSGANVDQVDSEGGTPVLSACSSGDLDIVKIMHQSGANLFLNSLLTVAAKHTSVIKYLVNNGLDVNHKSKDCTPLLITCTCNNYDGTQFLIENGADVNAVTEEGNITPMYIAAIMGHVQIVKLLLDFNADITIRSDGKSPIYGAACYDRVEILKLFAEEMNNVPAEENRNGIVDKSCLEEEWKRCFFHFATKGYTEILKFLHKSGLVKIDVKNETNSFTAFHYACFYGQCEAALYLIENGADVNKRTIQGCTSLFMASQNGHFNLVKLLVKHRSQVDIPNIHGQTALFVAASNGYLEIVDFLCENGASVNVGDVNGITPLYYAALKGHLFVVEHLVQFLFEVNVEVDIPNHHGNTSLFAAASNGHLEIVDFLYQTGSRVDVVDADGDTPLHDAAYRGHFSVVQYLVSKEANVGCRNNNGKTALDLATEEGNDEIAEFLVGKMTN